MTNALRIFQLADNLASNAEGFYQTKGAGKGNYATNSFIRELRALASKEFGGDFSEKNICGENSLAVDFFFPDSGTIVEVALSLKNAGTEYEKDILNPDFPFELVIFRISSIV